jgi:hypothetical protein
VRPTGQARGRRSFVSLRHTWAKTVIDSRVKWARVISENKSLIYFGGVEGSYCGKLSVMTDEQPKLYNIVTMIGALGALVMMLAAFFPLISTTAPKSGILWLSEYREQLQMARQKADEMPEEAKVILPVIVPTLDRLDAFLEHPSGYRLWFILQDAYRFCGLALSLQASFHPTEEALRLLEFARLALAVVILFLGSIPLLGGYHLIRGVLLRFRKLRTPALVMSFFFGLAYMMVAGLTIFGLPPAEQAFLGSAPYLLFAGAVMMVFCSLFGVSRSTWWRAYLLDILGLALLAYLFVWGVTTLQ